MSNPASVEKFGNGLLVIMDDGSRHMAIDSVGDRWLVSLGEGGSEPSPPSGDRFIFPAPLSVVTSEFGRRNGRLHAGMDFSGGPAVAGQPMIASSSGIVQVSTASHGGYGETVVLDHGGGLATLYAHMESGSRLVRVGDRVEQSQQIGRIGNTGQSYGAHIHFETHEGGYRWNASAVNPRTFIPKRNSL